MSHVYAEWPLSIELACMKKTFNLAIREWEWCRENPGD
jgi:hypothetical protein